MSTSKASSSSAANGAGASPRALRPVVPDSEVVVRPVRRRFTAEYKRSVLNQADAARDSGAIGVLLRREGLYSSHLGTWRRQRKQGELAGQRAFDRRGEIEPHDILSAVQVLRHGFAAVKERQSAAGFAP
jgi:hypothetical protein